METTLVTVIRNDPTLAALVGTRVYDRTLPKTPVMPAITFQKIDEPREYSHSGKAAAFPRIQFTCWGNTAASASAVATALEAAMDLLGQESILIMFVANRVTGHEATTNLYKEIVDFSAIRS